MYSPALSGAARNRIRTPRRASGESLNGGARRRHGSWTDMMPSSASPLPLRRATGTGTPTEHQPLLAMVSIDGETDDHVKRGHGTDCRALLGAVDVAKLTNALMYGVINSILTIPCMYGYAAIIFSHPDFAGFMPSLSKLVMFSSVVHQLMFTLLSSLPFAIGQVQDAGLIFLSAIASSICVTLGDSVSLGDKVATVVVTIGLATAALGLCLVLLGRFKLAGLVSYLPMPVVGGYLAYIGLFCLYAGLSLSTGLVINDFTSLLQMARLDYIVLSLPGLLGGLLLLVVSQRCDNSFALPACILGMPLVFFLLVWLTGSSMEDARAYGWVSPDAPPADFIAMWELFDFHAVHWHVIPRQLTTWLGMVFVVAFSSCLDVAAIEMDMGRRLDINHELMSVGWSNFISGVTGGYTGSYIFSQTIFTYRSKTDSRLVGVCVILSEFAIVLLPLSVMSFVPRFFFAATLIFIAIDLMVEWLVHVYHKVLPREYLVLWASFIAINWVSLELGMLLGIGFAILNFLIGYSQVRVVSRAFRRSSAVRKFAARTILSSKRDAIVYLELHGYLFFGSSVRILDDVQTAVHIAKKTSSLPLSGSLTSTNMALPPLRPLAPSQRASSFFTTATTPLNSGKPFPTTPTHQQQQARLQPHYEVEVECLDGRAALEPEGLPTEFVVMDLSRVSGMDATAARSSLMILQQQCKQHDISVLFADALPEIRRLLLQNEIADHGDFFPNADSALEYCENRLLERHDAALLESVAASGGALTPTRLVKTSTSSVADEDLAISTLLYRFMGEPDEATQFAGIERFFRRHEVPAGHVFYRVSEFPAHFYFLASGRVALLMNRDGSATTVKTLHLLEHVIPGAMFGEVDFFGKQYRHMAARATQRCVVYEMARPQYEAMASEAPALWHQLRDVVLQSMALTITNATSITSATNATTLA